MRKIEKIIIHCSAGNQRNTAADIVAYHRRPKAQGGRGWVNPGYHYIIEADGKVVQTLPEERVSNGCYGHNQTAINVCYVGGVDVSKKGLPPLDNRTPEQKTSLVSLLKDLRRRYPSARIHGHRDFAAKACPSFDATREFAALSLLIVMLLAFCSCRTRTEIREVPVVMERRTMTTDSLRSRLVSRDSIVAKDSVVTLIKGDTLIREAWRFREKTHTVHDTVVRLRHDTIYRDRPVAVTKTVAQKPESAGLSSKAIWLLPVLLLSAVILAWCRKRHLSRGGRR